MKDDKQIEDEFMEYPRIDPKDVEVGMDVKILYDSTFGGRIYRQGQVTDCEVKQTDSRELVKVEVRHSEHRATFVSALFRDSNGRKHGAYQVSSESSARTGPVGWLIAMYYDPESG
jgi:hypothetical protein